jgi:thiol-disulfide isomerase/thioredoxin
MRNRRTLKALTGILAIASLFVALGEMGNVSDSHVPVAFAAQLSEDDARVADTEEDANADTDESKARDVLIAPRLAARAPALAPGTWINSDPLKLDALRGRVVIVDFWTFGCYNCRNTLPTLKRWDARYREQGLTIIGVHTPESGYEKSVSNVRRAVREQSLRYPVVTDNEGDTWRAYGIEAWPTTIILDKKGRIRFRHIGEGYYAEMEKVIQQLLAEESATARQN